MKINQTHRKTRNLSWLILLVFFTPSAYLSAQNTVADSIRKQILKLDEDAPDYIAQKAGATGTLLQHLKYSHPNQALLLCDTLHDLFMELNDSVRAYEAKYRYKAGIYEVRGQADSLLLMLESYAEALSAIDKSDGYVYIDIGNVYFGFSMFGLATENYNRAEQIFLENGPLEGLCTIYNNRAQMHMAGELNVDSALKWLRRSYDVRANQLKDPVLAHESMYLMSVVFRRSEQYDSAKLFLWQVINDISSGNVNKHTDHIALRQEFSGAFTAMGIVHSAEGNADSAEYYFKEGEKIYLASGYQNRLPGLYNAWARFYIDQKDAVKSWEYLKKSESNTPPDNPNSMMTLYQLFADWYEWQGKTEDMYKYRLKYHELSDSLQSMNSAEQMMVVASRVLQLQDKAHIEKQRAEIAQRDLDVLQAERGRVRMIIIATALLIIVVISVYGLNQLRRKNAIIGKYNRELKSANATKEQFLSVISHDLRSPFNTLIGMSDLLRDNARRGNYSSVEQNADQISEASRKAFVLLDNLMQWVSIQKDNINVKKETFGADVVIDEVLFLLKEQSLSRNMTIVKDIRVEKLNTDRTLIQVVLRNLISNAVKYTPSGGTITITCSNVAGALEMKVEDSGTGFPEAELAVLMSREQGIGVAKKAGGLGLVLVRQFVHLLSGTIVAGNVKGGGAQVTVTLPDAAVGESISTVAGIRKRVQHSFTSEEKELLADLVGKLSKYELFDATEIRSLTENPIPGETENITMWRKNLLQSVYLADESKYAELIKSAID